MYILIRRDMITTWLQWISDFVRDCRAVPTRFKSKNYPNLRCMFSQKTIRNCGWYFFQTHYRENKFGSQANFIKPFFFGKSAFPHTFTFQPCSLNTLISKWHIYLILHQIWAWLERFVIASECINCPRWRKSLGYWWTKS